MDKKDAAFVIAVGLGLWYMATRSSDTLGGKESNAIKDAMDDVRNLVRGMPAGAVPYEAAIRAAADSTGVPFPILVWMLWEESRYNPKIIDGTIKSPVGAMGIAQFMPGTAKDILGSEAAALDPSKAIPGAARYLARLKKSTGSWKLALAAYNWGSGNLQRQGIAAAPRETRNYYTDILSKANAGGGNYV